MHTGKVLARQPNRTRPTTSFRVFGEAFPRTDLAQYLLSKAQDDLTQRLLRSYHWARRAHLEPDLQLKVLFRWFAMETIWKRTKGDGITPRVMWALGYPNGKGSTLLSGSFTSALRAHPTYATWKSQIEHLVKGVKTFRNDVVHSGFRRQDTAQTTLRLYDQITVIACARVQAVAREGVLVGLSTADELMEYLPVLVEEDENYVNDIHGNVIYGLENPMPRRWAQ